MTTPSTTLETLRGKIAKKLYWPRHPVLSATTAANAGGTAAATNNLVDTVLAAAGQTEDFIGAWVMTTSGTVAYSPAQTLATALTTLTGTAVVSSGTAVANGDVIKINDEKMLVTAGGGTANLTVTRGYWGTTKATHLPGESITYTQDGIVRRVTNVDFLGADSHLIIGPVWSSAVATGTTYEIHYKFHPDVVKNEINEILENIRQSALGLITLIADGDMEDTTDPATAGYFSVSGGTMTKTSVTTLHTTQALKWAVTASAQILTCTLSEPRPEPGERVLVQADVHLPAGGDVTMALRDVTNGADVETARATATGWQTLYFTATIPATCENPTVRFTNNYNSAHDIRISAISLVALSRGILSVPTPQERDWLEDTVEVIYFPLGDPITTTNASNAYRVWQGPTQKYGEFSMFRLFSEGYLELRSGDIANKPAPWFRGRTPYNTLSTDASSTPAPEDLVIDIVTAELLYTWADELDEKGQAATAQSKRARADRILNQLGPRWRHFQKDRGVINGTLRPIGRM